MSTLAEVKSLIAYWRSKKAKRVDEDVTEPTEDTSTEKSQLVDPGPSTQMIGAEGDHSPINETTFEHDTSMPAHESASSPSSLSEESSVTSESASCDSVSSSESNAPCVAPCDAPCESSPSRSLAANDSAAVSCNGDRDDGDDGDNCDGNDNDSDSSSAVSSELAVIVSANEHQAECAATNDDPPNNETTPITPRDEGTLLSNLGELTNIDTERTDQPAAAFHLSSHIQTDTAMADVGDSSDEKCSLDYAGSQNASPTKKEEEMTTEEHAEEPLEEPQSWWSSWSGAKIMSLLALTVVSIVVLASFFWRMLAT